MIDMPDTVAFSHGAPYPEVIDAKDQPAGIPAPARRNAHRDSAGRLLPGPGTIDQARRAGRASAEARQLAQLLGLWSAPEGHPFGLYSRLAREWRDEHMRQLAATVGGGEVGAGPASIVSSAALQLAASRYLSDAGARDGNAKLLLDASRLADASRQNILAAHHLCAREAAARPKRQGSAMPWFADDDEPVGERTAAAAIADADEDETRSESCSDAFNTDEQRKDAKT